MYFKIRKRVSSKVKRQSIAISQMIWMEYEGFAKWLNKQMVETIIGSNELPVVIIVVWLENDFVNIFIALRDTP